MLMPCTAFSKDRNMAKPLHDQIIIRALAIIEDGSRWTQGALARLSNGVECPCFDARAERFCAAGALYRAACELSGANSWLLAQEAEQRVLMRNGWRHMSLTNVNDIQGHECVVAMFRKAVGKDRATPDDIRVEGKTTALLVTSVRFRRDECDGEATA